MRSDGALQLRSIADHPGFAARARQHRAYLAVNFQQMACSFRLQEL
jgi:hypothetical protein